MRRIAFGSCGTKALSIKEFLVISFGRKRKSCSSGGRWDCRRYSKIIYLIIQFTSIKIEFLGVVDRLLKNMQYN